MKSVLLIAAMVFAQPDVPSKEPPTVPQIIVDPPVAKVEPKIEPKKQKLPMVVFSGLPAREIPGCTVYRDDKWLDRPGVAAYPVAGDEYADGTQWKYNPSDQEILRSLGKGVQAYQPNPFQAPHVQPEVQGVGASSALWYSPEQVEVVRKIWPAGVEFPKTLKFYSLAPLYQKMYTMNNGRSRFADPTHISHERELPEFTVSGGMTTIVGYDQNSNPIHKIMDGWKSDKGFAFAGTLAEVWKEDTNVRAFSLVPRWRWKFKNGVIAYDVLSTDKGVFEIRTQTRTDEGWETKIAYRNLNNTNGGYKGLEDGQTCASCHSHTGELLSRPGQIYLWERWGSDGRFSWRPYNESGQLANWPIELK